MTRKEQVLKELEEQRKHYQKKLDEWNLIQAKKKLDSEENEKLYRQSKKKNPDATRGANKHDYYD